MIEDDFSLHKRIEKLEDMIRSLQVASQTDSLPPVDPSVKCLNRKQTQQQFPTSLPKGGVQSKIQQPGQNKMSNKRHFVQPFNASVDVQQGQTRQTSTSPYLGDRTNQDSRPTSGGYGNQPQNLVGAGAVSYTHLTLPTILRV